MRWKLKCVVEPEEDWYVSCCEELDIASQGETVNEAKENLEEAIEMFLEDASLSEILGLLVHLKPKFPVEIQRRPEILSMQNLEEQDTKWELVIA